MPAHDQRSDATNNDNHVEFIAPIEVQPKDEGARLEALTGLPRPNRNNPYGSHGQAGPQNN